MISTAPAKWTPRRVPLIVALVLMVLTLAGTGCSMIVGFDTKVNQDGSGTVGVRVAADKELQSALGQQAGLGVSALFSGLQSQMGPEWKTSTGTDPDGTQWTVAARSFKDPAELETITTSTLGGASPFSDVSLTQSDSLFSVRTAFTATMDAGKVTSSPDVESQIAQIPANILSSVVKVENRLTLPGTIGSNNATEVQGNTLIWRGEGTTSAITMTAESVSYKWGAVGAAIVGVLLIIALVVVIIVLMARRRKRRAAIQAPTAASGDATLDAAVAAAPAAPAQLAGPATPQLESSPAQAEIAERVSEAPLDPAPETLPAEPEPAIEPAAPVAEPPDAQASPVAPASPETSEFLAPLPVTSADAPGEKGEDEGAAGPAETAPPGSADDPSH